MPMPLYIESLTAAQRPSLSTRRKLAVQWGIAVEDDLDQIRNVVEPLATYNITDTPTGLNGDIPVTKTGGVLDLGFIPPIAQSVTYAPSANWDVGDGWIGTSVVDIAVTPDGSAIFVLTKDGTSLHRLERYDVTTMTATHSVTFGSGVIAVPGYALVCTNTYVWALYANGSGSCVVQRYSATDLTGGTSVTGTVGATNGANTCALCLHDTDGQTLYIISSNTSAGNGYWTVINGSAMTITTNAANYGATLNGTGWTVVHYGGYLWLANGGANILKYTDASSPVSSATIAAVVTHITKAGGKIIGSGSTSVAVHTPGGSTTSRSFDSGGGYSYKMKLALKGYSDSSTYVYGVFGGGGTTFTGIYVGSGTLMRINVSDATLSWGGQVIVPQQGWGPVPGLLTNDTLYMLSDTGGNTGYGDTTNRNAGWRLVAV